MPRYSIIANDNCIVKDGVSFNDLDLSWLPSNILAVQSSDGVQAEIEIGDRGNELVLENESITDVSLLSWWPNVDATFQAKLDEIQAAEQAALDAYNAANPEEPA